MDFGYFARSGGVRRTVFDRQSSLSMARCAELNRSLVEIVVLMGCAGFGCAIGVHLAVGYLDFFHLLSAFLGFVIFVLAAALFWVGRRKNAVRVAERSENSSVRGFRPEPQKTLMR